MRAWSQSLPAVLLGILVTAAAAPLFAHSQQSPLETELMPYPFWVEPGPDDIYHVPTGLKLSFDGMMDILAGGRVVFVGETHNNIHAHRVQVEIIRELHRRFPGRMAIGMEMFREDQQEALDRWTKGEVSETGFLKESRWFQNWTSDFAYYREIMNFARDEGIDVIALNPSMELQRAVGMSGGKPLPPELAARVPDTDSSDPFQRAYLRAIHGGHQGGEAMFEAFLRVQLLWEETMAQRIVDYLGSPRGEGRIMVVLTGGAHVQYGFGVPKKVVRRMPLPYFIVLPSPISIPEELREEVLMEVETPPIPLLPADFIWMVPYEILEERKVMMGITMSSGAEGVTVDKVMEESPAALAGIKPGDLLLTLDDMIIEDMSDVRLVVNTKRVGDTMKVGLRRGGEEIILQVRFQEPAVNG